MAVTFPDARTHAYDPVARRAEQALRGALAPDDGAPPDETNPDDWTYVTPRPMTAVARLSLRARPQPGAPQVTEALPGEATELLWTDGQDWAYLRTLHDRYLGWTPLAGLRDGGADGSLMVTALSVTALRAHAFAGPGVSQPIVAELCLGSRLSRAAGEVAEEGGRRWVPVTLPGGQAAWVGEAAFAPLRAPEPAALVLQFLDTPYVWGGRSAWGLDCSGLTQLVYAAFGQALPRDADQQQRALEATTAPRRGDLAFFPGHVGLMLDERRMVHANATHMRVSVETLGEGAYGQALAASCTGFGRWTA